MQPVAKMSPSVAIVQVLQKYGEVPLDFVAEVVGRQRSEIEGFIRDLQTAGVVRREGEMVLLNQGSVAGRRSSRP